MDKNNKGAKLLNFGSSTERIVAVCILLALGLGAYAVATGEFLSLLAAWVYLLPLLVIGVVLQSIRTAREGKLRTASLPSAYTGWRKAVKVIEIGFLVFVGWILLMLVITNFLPR